MITGHGRLYLTMQDGTLGCFTGEIGNAIHKFWTEARFAKIRDAVSNSSEFT